MRANEGKTGITSLEWDSGTGPEHTSLVFADKKGHVGVFEVPLPKEASVVEKSDPVVDDSLLMEVRCTEAWASCYGNGTQCRVSYKKFSRKRGNCHCVRGGWGGEA